MTPHSALPLEGVRVVDLTSNIAAPFGSAVLADLGATVVHVEPPQGDDSRRMSPRLGDTSAYWEVVNRNKSVVQLDLRSATDRAALDELIAAADVFVTNLRPHKLAAAALDAATLCAQYDRLIHASLSGYGDAGTERERAGYDGVLQARTGIAAVTGETTGPPVRVGVSILDVGAGTWLALGVLAALYRREHTGRGGSVDTSLFETGANWVAYHVAAHQISGEASARHGSAHPAFAPYGIYRTKDGQVCLGIGGEDLFGRLCGAIERPDLLNDARFRRNVDRVQFQEDLRTELESTFAHWHTSVLIASLDKIGIPCDTVALPEALLTDPQAAALDLLTALPTSQGAVLRIPALPIRLDGERPRANITEEADSAPG